MNEGFAAIGYVALANIPFTPTPVTLPIVYPLERGDAPAPVATLIDADMYDTGLDDVVTKLWAERPMIYPDNTVYEARLKSRVEIEQSGLDSIGVGGRVALTISTLELDNADNEFNAPIAQALSLGRRALIRTMPAPEQTPSDCGGGDLANASVLFTGIVAAMSAGRDVMTLTLSDLGERLNVPLQASLYAGTGGLEGTEDLTGVPRPVALGFTFNSTPVYIGLVDLGDGLLPTYQSNWRQILGHIAVRERGVTMTKTTSAPGIGEWRDWPASGAFQLGFTPNGIVTCDLRGDSAGGYRGTTAGVIERMLISLGPVFSPSDIDSISFSDLDARLPGEMGWRRGAEYISAVDAIEEVLAHSGVWLSGGRNGTLRVSAIDVHH